MRDASRLSMLTARSNVSATAVPTSYVAPTSVGPAGPGWGERRLRRRRTSGGMKTGGCLRGVGMCLESDDATERRSDGGPEGSLVIGHLSLVTGHWSRVIGHWSLVTCAEGAAPARTVC